MGFRRKYNDKLLMFRLRHYGEDAHGRRTTINYFSTRASAGAGAGEGAAEAATTTVRTVITGGSPGAGRAASDDERGARGDRAAAVLGAFEGVRLDAEAEAAIAAALEACAARARAADSDYEKGGRPAVEAAADDPAMPFVRADFVQAVAIGALEPAAPIEEFVPFVQGEAPWELAGAERPAALIAFEEERAAAARAGPGAARAPAGRREARAAKARSAKAERKAAQRARSAGAAVRPPT